MYYFDRIIDNKLKIEYPFMFRCINFEQLVEHENTFMKSQIEMGVKDYFRLHVECNGLGHCDTYYGSLLDELIKIKGGNILTTGTSIENEIFNGKKKALLKFGGIYLREIGSYMPITDKYSILETIETENFVYPGNNFTKDDIRIIQWRNGLHYYAKIGNYDVVDYGGKQKWNSHDEAMIVAKEYLKRLNKKVGEVFSIRK
jgi:hypothetical protein